MNQPVFIVCGVPGSGKSWVCEQLATQFSYVAHDGWNQRDKISSGKYLEGYARTLFDHAMKTNKPVLGDCPFAERTLRCHLESLGLKPNFVFLHVDPSDLLNRYVERMKPLPKSHLTRLKSIGTRAKEWKSFFGTSDDALWFLQRESIRLRVIG